MSISNTIRPRLLASRRPLLGVLVVSAIIKGIIILLSLRSGASMDMLTRDPMATAELPVYTGILSQVGVFLWVAAATVCLFCARVVLSSSPRTELRNFLYCSGGLTVILGMDDAFLVHELVFPRVGVDEKIVVASYGVLTLALLVRFRETIFETNYVLLAVGLLFFALSVLLDQVDPQGIHPFEEAAKLVGIVSWVAYFIDVGRYAAGHKPALSAARASAVI